MATTTLAAGQSMTVTLQPNETKAYQGTLTGTSTLTPTVSYDGGVTYVAPASDALGTVVSGYTATFGAVHITAPSTGMILKLANTSGAGSWAIAGAV